MNGKDARGTEREENDDSSILTFIIGGGAILGGVLSYAFGTPVPDGGLAVLLGVIIMEVRDDE